MQYWCAGSLVADSIEGHCSAAQHAPQAGVAACCRLCMRLVVLRCQVRLSTEGVHVGGALSGVKRPMREL